RVVVEWVFVHARWIPVVATPDTRDVPGMREQLLVVLGRFQRHIEQREFAAFVDEVPRFEKCSARRKKTPIYADIAIDVVGDKTHEDEVRGERLSFEKISEISLVNAVAGYAVVEDFDVGFSTLDQPRP